MQQRKNAGVCCTSRAAGFHVFCRGGADDQFGGKKLQGYMLPTSCSQEDGTSAGPERCYSNKIAEDCR